MKKNNNLKIVLVIFALVAAYAMYYWYMDSKKPGVYDDFATCLGKSGLKFYGAFWCPHCQKEKSLFGKSKDLLPYVECSTADGKGQTDICKEKGVTGYPTWEYTKPGATSTTMESGEKTLEELSSMTGCQLPKVEGNN